MILSIVQENRIKSCVAQGRAAGRVGATGLILFSFNGKGKRNELMMPEQSQFRILYRGLEELPSNLPKHKAIYPINIKPCISRRYC